jgi:DDE superfamily endonuclease
MEETSQQRVGEARVSLAMEPGPPPRQDYEYTRQGVAPLFLFAEPLTGGRQVPVTERRTRADGAEARRPLGDQPYPRAQRITGVLDNLPTHGPASFDQAFTPDEAQRLSERLEFHDTPQHGSWLQRAEIEFSLLSRQCLDRRIDTAETLRNQTRAWQQQRQAASKTIDGPFTTAEARIKLKRLYPVIKT